MSHTDTARLLIADDDPNLLAAYVVFFSAFGFEIRTAADGCDALAQFRAWHPEAAVLDVEMPRMDGREVAKQIRSLEGKRACVLVAVTGLAHPSDRNESLRSGFDHHFVKPVAMSTILAALNARGLQRPMH